MIWHHYPERTVGETAGYTVEIVRLGTASYRVEVWPYRSRGWAHYDSAESVHEGMARAEDYIARCRAEEEECDESD